MNDALTRDAATSWAVFEGTRAGNDAIGGLDQQVCRDGDGLSCGDEALGPAVVLLVKGLLGAGATALRHNLLLRCRGGLDQIGNRIRDAHHVLEDRRVHLHVGRGQLRVAWLVDEGQDARTRVLDHTRGVQHLLLDDVAKLGVW
ncbi:hypothetical protein BC936DRAFT_138127 [Jimgerdemannia flammicorona]|uniref:Uncharacterized protein n=1 Tax=Jimgerdemannia flammicorona TaxID=994334 RepID=A0A433DIP2_9FUNG|nr:hypothetical protein BC936DRAFT_138127 [Jimgerdemannia flammicorona]